MSPAEASSGQVAGDLSEQHGGQSHASIEPGRILIVCTGNVCRSPFIHLLLQRELDSRRPDGSPGIAMTSAGTAALTGYPMDERAAAQLIARDGDPAGFVARQLTAAMVAEADLVLTATRRHRGQVATLHPKALRYAFAFRDFADLVSQLDVAELDIAAPEAVRQSRARLQALVRAAAGRRGVNPPLDDSQADIVDPFRQEDEVFVQMAQQVGDSMPMVVAAMAG